MSKYLKPTITGIFEIHRLRADNVPMSWEDFTVTDDR